MALPPVDGYWYTFHNQTDWTHTNHGLQLDPNCALMHEPAA